MAHLGREGVHCSMLVPALEALEAELVSQPKRNDNMPNEFVVSQSCSRVNAANSV
jgi:hypothetical protein